MQVAGGWYGYLGSWRNGYEDIMSWQRFVYVNVELGALISGLLNECLDGWMGGWVVMEVWRLVDRWSVGWVC